MLPKLTSHVTSSTVELTAVTITLTGAVISVGKEAESDLGGEGGGGGLNPPPPPPALQVNERHNIA